MITSPGNARMKAVMQMKQKAKVRRNGCLPRRKASKCFWRRPRSGFGKSIFPNLFPVRTKKLEAAVREKLDRELGREQKEVVSREVFDKISATCSPQGILCVMKAYHYTLSDLLQKEAPLLLLLENIYRTPGNLGTMLRTGEGAGIDGVILSADSADMGNPKTVRSTMGSVYRVPFCIRKACQIPSKRCRIGGSGSLRHICRGNGLVMHVTTKAAAHF